MMKVKYYKCPECSKKFKTLTGWGNHMDTNHPGSRPEGYSISRYFYFVMTGKTHGVCRTCKGDTPWNEGSMKYDQYCTNPECKKAYVKIAKQRMIGKYGKVHLLNDPDVQKRMLQNRKISGKYRFDDGTEFEYVGSYEKAFLEMMNTMMEWHSNDLIAPSPHVYYYSYKNEKDIENEGTKFYIPDFFIPSLNLEIEIKQQTSTNKAMNEINRVKEQQKDEVMRSNKNVNYLKINDNNFTKFFEFIMKAKEYIPTSQEIRKDQMELVVESFKIVSYDDDNVFLQDEENGKQKTMSRSKYEDLYGDIKTSGTKSYLEKNPEVAEYVYDGDDETAQESAKYSKPYNYDEIVNNYGKKIADNLMSDPAHEFRANSGIELIHKEPSAKELKRIWKNWNLMDSNMKKISDNKSIELFGMNNKDHYHILINEWRNSTPNNIANESHFTKNCDIDFNQFKNYKNIIIGETHSPESYFLFDAILDAVRPEYFICEMAYEDKVLTSKDLEKRIASATNGKFLKNVPDRQDNLWIYELALKYNCKLIGCDYVKAPHKYESMDDECSTRESHMLEVMKLFEKKKFVAQIGDYHLRSIPITEDFCKVMGQNPNDSMGNRLYNCITSSRSVIWEYFSSKPKAIIYRVNTNYEKEMSLESYGLQSTNTLIDEFRMDDIAQEGLLSFLQKKKDPDDFKVKPWTDVFGLRKGLFGFFGGTSYLGAKITSNGMIEIHGINFTTLKNRIKKQYGDKSINNIFLPKYNALSYRRFEKKKIQRCEIKIDYLYTPEFFALELVNLFMDLGKRFRDRLYIQMANQIYENSWLSIADAKSEQVPLLNTSRLSNISLNLNDYQKEFIEKYPKLKAQLNMNGYILAFEQGLGKTLTAISLSECLNVDHVYIVCPNSLKENWALEIKKYYAKYEDDDLWRQEVFICSNKPSLFNENTTKFMIINNESIEKMYPYVMPGKNMLILDESHNFRNIKSKRVGQLLKLRDLLKCTDTLIMSGTPIKATPDEIVPALMMIDPTFNKTAAECFSKAFKLHESMGTSLVQNRFGKIMYRKEKDVLKNTLPEKNVLPLRVSTPDSNRYLMENVNSAVMNRFSAIYDNGLQEMMSMRSPFFEITKRYSYPSDDFERFTDLINQVVRKDVYLHEIDQMFIEKYMKDVTERIKSSNEKKYYISLIKGYVRYKAHCLGLAFGQILPPYRRDMFNSMYDANVSMFYRMITENVKKTLIFTQFKEVAYHINDDLNNAGIGSVIITGDVKDRMTVLREFKENDNIRVLVATSQTIGTGVTLVEASQMFFFGPPWRQSDFDQCSDRIHRIGQTDDVYIYNVILQTTELNLSTRMDDILAWSKKMTESVISKSEDTDDIDETNFEEILTANESVISTPAMENYLISKKPIKYKIDEFKDGTSNILLITGLSGSGKSTMASNYAKQYNAEWVELDWFECNYGMTDDALRQCSEPLYIYLTNTPAGKKFREKSRSDNKPSGKELLINIRTFGSWLLKWCENHKDKKWIIEGVQIYSCFDFDLVKKYPIIINCNSTAKSIKQRIDRDGNEGEFIKMCKWYLDETKLLTSFKKAVAKESYDKLTDKEKELYNEFFQV